MAVATDLRVWQSMPHTSWTASSTPTLSGLRGLRLPVVRLVVESHDGTSEGSASACGMASADDGDDDEDEESGYEDDSL